jgi:MscS family membrane protein
MPRPAFLTSWLARFVALLVLLAVPLARAEQPSCENPQAAARSLLDWLERDRWDPVSAATCLELSEARADEGPALAVKMKRVLDARGLYIPTDTLPAEPDYVDEDGRARVVPIPTFPTLTLVKRGDRWLYGRAFVSSADGLYDATFSRLSGRVQSLVPPALRFTFLGLHTWQFVYVVLLLVGAVVAGWLTHRLLSSQINRIASGMHLRLDVAWLGRMHAPITWLAMGGVVRWGIPDLQLGAISSRALLFCATTVVSFAAVLILVRLVDIGADMAAKHAASTPTELDDQAIPLVTRALRVAIWGLGLVFILQNSGVAVGSLLAGLGLGGLAFALAAKDTVENFFGSIVILTDRPFGIGDRVFIDGVEGVVEEVGFRSTRVRTAEDSVVSVPNGKVAAAKIDNYGRRNRRRLLVNLGVTYDTPREKMVVFLERLRALLEADGAVVEGSVEVALGGFGASSLDVMVLCYLTGSDWHVELGHRSRLFLEFMRIAEEVGVRFAFPSTSLYVESLPAAPSRAREGAPVAP